MIHLNTGELIFLNVLIIMLNIVMEAGTVSFLSAIQVFINFFE